MPNRNNEIPAANPASATSRRRQTVTVPPAPAPLAGTQPLTEAGRQRMVAASRSRLLAGTGAKVFWAVLAVAVVAGSIGFALLLHANPVASASLAVATLVGYAIFLWWILSPIIVRVGMWSMARAGWLVGYFDETATQLVHPWSGGWELSDHHAVVQGAGIAAPFRRRVFTHLAAEADRHQVPITMSSRIPKLVAIYQADMPGLRVIGTARTLFGTLYQLRRDPAAPPPADPVNGDGSATTEPA